MKIITMSRFLRSDQGVLHIRHALLIVALLFCGYSWSDNLVSSSGEKIAPPQQHTKHTQEQAAAGQRGTEKLPFVVQVVNVPKAQVRLSDNENKGTDRLPFIWGMTPEEATAMFTFFLVIVGALTAFVLICQSILLRRQVSAAREEFVASHPPSIIARRFQFRHRGADEPPIIEFVIANEGRSAAKIVSSNVSAKILRNEDIKQLHKNSFAPYEGGDFMLKRIDYAPGEREAQALVLNRIEDRNAALEGIANHSLTVVCFGYIRYEDAMHVQQETRFFRTSSPTEEFFIARPDPDYDNSQ